MQQGRADGVSKAWFALASPELAIVWQKGMDADASMTRTEATQWFLMCRSTFFSLEDSVLQHQVGALKQATFDSYSAVGPSVRVPVAS